MDPNLWRELRKRFLDYGVSKTLEDFDSELALQFQEMVGVPFTTSQENVFIDRYDKGGMSSGHISPEWWREIGIPLLRERFILLNPMQVIQTPKDSDESN
jgi:molybdenum cofactor cytidylyltransferase